MSDVVYRKLADVLDTLPNGFPSTEEGIEIQLLKKVFTPEEAELFCDLRLTTYETPDQIAQRTGRPLEGLDEKLTTMWKRGQIFGIDFGSTRVFKMLPWVFGIYEFQLDRMDREFAELSEKYHATFAPQFFKTTPQLMQVVPIEKTLPNSQEPLPYHRVSSLIENGQSFGVAQCICKKEQSLLGHGCDNPQEVCLGIAPVPGIFENYHWGRPISKEEALEVLRRSEEAGLVHMTGNVEEGHFYICNCCGCCCGVLRSINQFGLPEGVNSHYYAEIDTESCVGCGICADERCQVNAIEEQDDAYRVIQNKCIGCGLCATTCPSDAIRLVSKDNADRTSPPKDEAAWFEARGRERGVDFSQFA